MNLSLWGIRYPLPSVLAFVLLTVAGFWGWHKLPISQLPDIALPTIQITVGLPGAAPSTLETDVTRKIEDAVSSIPDIDKITSAVSEGTSITKIEFELGRDLDQALDEVKDAVARVRRDLPADINEPTVQRMNLVGGTLIAFAVESDRLAPDELSWFVDDKVSRAVYSVAGVGSVSRVGGIVREVRVELRPEALQALGVSAGAVSAQLARLQVEKPGGRTETGGAEQAVRTVAIVRTAAELADYPIYLPDGRSVRLSSIATVTDGAAEARAAALLDDKPVVGFSVRRTAGSSEVDVGQGVRARIAKLQAEHPEVRFVEVLCPNTGHDRWDQHANLRGGLADNCRMVDRPIAAMLEDLAARGMLEDTLVVYSGEFGRTPFAQGRDGRDHNPFGFTTWMAGGGIRAGASYGATDDYGYAAVDRPFSIHDMHATMLHLLGVDHERFTFRFGGRDIRLTDVYGKVPRELLA